jgi:hypothetical protein
MNDTTKDTIYRTGVGLASAVICLIWIMAFLTALSLMPGLLTIDRAVWNWPTLLTLLVCLLVLVGLIISPAKPPVISKPAGLIESFPPTHATPTSGTGSLKKRAAHPDGGQPVKPSLTPHKKERDRSSGGGRAAKSRSANPAAASKTPKRRGRPKRDSK